MMNEKNLPKSYWVDATNTILYLMNRCTTSGVQDVTPHEKLFRKKPDLSHVRIFGSIAYVYIPDEKWQKLDPKSEKCIVVGYSLEQKGHRCFNPSTENVRVSRDIVIDESTSWYESDSIPTQVDQEIEDDGRPWHLTEQSPITTRLSGPQEPPSDRSTTRPSLKMDKGRPEC